MREINKNEFINFNQNLIDNFVEDLKIEIEKRAIYFQDKDEQKDFYKALSDLQKVYRKKIEKFKKEK